MPVVHAAAAKRSSIPIFPPKSRDNSSWSGLSVLTQSASLSANLSYTEDERLRQTNRVGGEAFTLQTADPEMPARPTVPSVVITFTQAPSLYIPSRDPSFLMA